MKVKKQGVVKWMRPDGTGYLCDDAVMGEVIYVDRTSFLAGALEANQVRGGESVAFDVAVILDRKVAVNVEIL